MDIHTDIVNKTIRDFAKGKFLPEHIAKALVDNPKTARFYLPPKVHKMNNPGRPITNAINSPTSFIKKLESIRSLNKRSLFIHDRHLYTPSYRATKTLMWWIYSWK